MKYEKNSISDKFCSGTSSRNHHNNDYNNDFDSNHHNCNYNKQQHNNNCDHNNNIIYIDNLYNNAIQFGI